MPVFERGWWSAVLQHAYLPLRTSRTQADVTFLQPQVDMDGCILVSGLYGKPCGFNRRRAVGLVAFRDSGCNFLGIDDNILAILDLKALGLGLFLHPLFGLAVDEDTVDAVARGFVDRVESDPIGGGCSGVQRDPARNLTELYEPLLLGALSCRHDAYSESPGDDSKTCQCHSFGLERIIFQKLTESRSEIDSGGNAVLMVEMTVVHGERRTKGIEVGLAEMAFIESGESFRQFAYPPRRRPVFH
jgi:hypothetical protein